MANRHLSRSIAVQSLFEFDFFGGVTKKAADASKKKELEAILERTIEEFGPGLDDGSFAKKLAFGVITNQKEIDDIIEKRRRNGRYRRSRPLTAMSCALAYMSCYMGREKRFL